LFKMSEKPNEAGSGFLQQNPDASKRLNDGLIGTSTPLNPKTELRLPEIDESQKSCLAGGERQH
jgi:hypothetical protein